MKRFLLFGIGSLMAVGVIAQTEAPKILPDFYSTKISANGRIIVSKAYDDAAIYNTETGEMIIPESFSPGEGNCVSADGSIVVGLSEDDIPVILKNGKEIDLSSITNKYSFCDVHGITADGRRVVGVVTNPRTDNETMWVPMYFDFNSDGTVGEINYLPYPEKDWMGLDPQYVWASWVSSDGKTILGQIRDYTGYGVYPILFKEGADGEWTYTLPTAHLINPDNAPIPVYPGDFELVPPNIEDYMTDAEKAAYQEAYDEWVASEYTTEYPMMENFMSAEEVDAFNKAADEYNEKALAYNEKLFAYFGELAKIRAASVFFVQNNLAMNAEGTTVAMAADKEVVIYDDGEEFETEKQNPTYILDTTSGEMKIIKDLENGLYPTPRQILSDGTIIGVTSIPSFGVGVPPLSYVVTPDSDEYIPFEDQLEKYNPSAVAWLKENFTKEVSVGVDPETWEPLTATLFLSGTVVVSDDWTVVSGGEMAYLYNNDIGGGGGIDPFAEEGEGDDDDEYDELPLFESYLIFNEKSGVSSVSDDSRIMSRKYFDINGVEVNNPSNGIYIERSCLSDGRIVTAKRVIR